MTEPLYKSMEQFLKTHGTPDEAKAAQELNQQIDKKFPAIETRNEPPTQTPPSPEK